MSHPKKKEKKDVPQERTVCFLFLPEAIFTTGSIIGTLIGTLDVFMCSSRPITPLLSCNKKRGPAY